MAGDEEDVNAADTGRPAMQLRKSALLGPRKAPNVLHIRDRDVSAPQSDISAKVQCRRRDTA